MARSLRNPHIGRFFSTAIDATCSQNTTTFKRTVWTEYTITTYLDPTSHADKSTAAKATEKAHDP